MKKGNLQTFRGLLLVHYRERRVLAHRSMIVPVWLSSSSKPETEILVNAVIDTESDATFTLKEICEQLNTETQPTRFRLSTILSHESLIDSERVSSL